MRKVIIILLLFIICSALSAQVNYYEYQKVQDKALCISGIALTTASVITFNKSNDPKVNIGIATVGLITTAIGIIQLRNNKQISVYALKCNKTITPGIKVRF